MGISACILTYNEEDNIEECIETIQNYVDEIIIIDDYSTDNTINLAKKYDKTKIYKNKLERFDLQRNYSIRKANNEWVMVLDADERPTPALLEKMPNLLKTKKYDGYSFLIEVPTGFNRPFPRIDTKIFKKSKGRYRGYVHEHVILDGRVKFIPEKIYHYHKSNKIKNKKFQELGKKDMQDKSFFNIPIRTIIYPIKYFYDIYIGLELYKKGIKGFLKSIKYTFLYTIWGLRKL